MTRPDLLRLLLLSLPFVGRSETGFATPLVSSSSRALISKGQETQVLTSPTTTSREKHRRSRFVWRHWRSRRSQEENRELLVQRQQDQIDLLSDQLSETREELEELRNLIEIPHSRIVKFVFATRRALGVPYDRSKSVKKELSSLKRQVSALNSCAKENKNKIDKLDKKLKDEQSKIKLLQNGLLRAERDMNLVKQQHENHLSALESKISNEVRKIEARSHWRQFQIFFYSLLLCPVVVLFAPYLLFAPFLLFLALALV